MMFFQRHHFGNYSQQLTGKCLLPYTGEWFSCCPIGKYLHPSHIGKRVHQLHFGKWLIVFFLLISSDTFAGTKSWTGYGGDSNWWNPLNWSGMSIPLRTDDVLLDNSSLPGSYQVVLPDSAVTLRTLHIFPSPGQSIELMLPATNKLTNAFTVTGPGYGIELNAGAVFRNASGIASGESLSIADSIIIHDGGRYIHQTRASHANSILKFLSTAPGTEEGVFDFDVPRASYTISASNRIYGSLELHATTFGDTVNYTCTGANLLLVRGTLRIGVSVSMSVDFSGPNGNIQVNGDFIQEGGKLNLASGKGDSSALRINGDLYQSPDATIIETSNLSPCIELDGASQQALALSGKILNQVGLRINNSAGCVLQLPFKLPWFLDLRKGVFTTTATALLTLDSVSSVKADTTASSISYIDGPMRKVGLNGQDHFLFPVGKEGALRWMELKNATGNYTVEYIRQDPHSLSSGIGPGLDHISALEYWAVTSDGVIGDSAKVELSFNSAQSGGVTDPRFLLVAGLHSGQWTNIGNTAITGDFIRGSVLSASTDLGSIDYTLASSIATENPLPITTILLKINGQSGNTVFSWTTTSSAVPDHFILYEEVSGQSVQLDQIKAVGQQKAYSWSTDTILRDGLHYFKIVMVDTHGVEYDGDIVPFKKLAGATTISWIVGPIQSGNPEVLIQTDHADRWSYEIVSVGGQIIKKG